MDEEKLAALSKMVQTDSVLGCKLLLAICADNWGVLIICEEVVRKLKLLLRRYKGYH